MSLETAVSEGEGVGFGTSNRCKSFARRQIGVDTLVQARFCLGVEEDSPWGRGQKNKRF